MAKVTINNKNLHQVKMKLKDRNELIISCLSYPEHIIKFEEKKGRFILKVPPLLAIALYYDGILPQNKKESFRIKVKNKNIGVFQVEDLKYPDELHDDGLVEVELESVGNG